MHYIILESLEDKHLPADADDETREANRVDYAVSLRLIIRNGAGTGFSLDEVRRGVRILDNLEGKKAGDVVALEDADYDHLMAQVKVFRFGVVDQRFLQMITDLENAPTTDPTLTVQEAEHIAETAS